MTSQHMIYNHPLLDEMVKKYQESRGLPSWSAAATELMIRGIQVWIDQDDSSRLWGIDELHQSALNTEYAAWRKKQLGLSDTDYEPFMSDEEENLVKFYRFMLDKVSPKRGGKRAGQGRPKGSRNKLK